MPTTPVLNFPYPGEGDGTDGPAQIQVLAETVETYLTGLPNRFWQSRQSGTSNITSDGSNWSIVPAVGIVMFNPGGWQAGSSGLIIPVTGTYKVWGAVSFAQAPAGFQGSRGARIGLNDVITPVLGTSVLIPPAGSAGGAVVPTCVAYVQCTAGTAVFLQALQNSGSTLATNPGGSTLAVERVA